MERNGAAGSNPEVQVRSEMLGDVSAATGAGSIARRTIAAGERCMAVVRAMRTHEIQDKDYWMIAKGIKDRPFLAKGLKPGSRVRIGEVVVEIHAVRGDRVDLSVSGTDRHVVVDRPRPVVR